MTDTKAAIEALERLMLPHLPKNAAGSTPFPARAFERGSFPDYDTICAALSEPKPVDVGGLKLAPRHFCVGGTPAFNQKVKGWNECIDHLHQRGLICADTESLKRENEKLREALVSIKEMAEWESGHTVNTIQMIAEQALATTERGEGE